MRKLLFLTSLMRWGTNALVCMLGLDFITQVQGIWHYLPIFVLVFFDIISLVMVRRNSEGKNFGLSIVDLLVSWIPIAVLLNSNEFILATVAFLLSITSTFLEFNFLSIYDNKDDSQTD